MNGLRPKQRLAGRVLAGCVGILMLARVAGDVKAGFFVNHGEPFRQADHPITFWLLMAFIAVLGLSALYWAAFGTRGGPKN